MNAQELKKRQERAGTEPMVIARTDAGFRVHSPTRGGAPYIVGGTPEAPTCTCPDFTYHANDPAWRCKHILAVRERYGTRADSENNYEEEERAAIRAEAAPPPLRNGTAGQMLIKRSVSPDGRIDSLSVEFSCPVEILEQDLHRRARELIEIQSGIVQTFLARQNGERAGPTQVRRTREPEADESIPAQLMRVGGMDGKWGRRLYITVQANGRALRLYGSPGKLADHLRAAGHSRYAEDIREGTALDLACRIVTTESANGFVSIEKVLPALDAR